MAHQMIHDIFRQTNLTNESSDYLSKRDVLRLAEIELMHQRERVADLRRNLPEGAVVQDYVFEEGTVDLDAGDAPTRTVRLSEPFDLTTQGRGDWYAERGYGTKVHGTHR